MTENWAPIKGFEGVYEVSDLGRVRRLPSKGSPNGGILKPCLDDHDYMLVGFSHGGKQFTKKVHRLVAQAFILNPLGLPEVNHIGTKADNRATMLEWRSKRGHNQDQAKRKQKGNGVHFYKQTGRWLARYSHEPNKRTHLGYFDTREEAQAVHDAAVDAMPYIL